MATPAKTTAPEPTVEKKESSAANRRYTEASRRLREKYTEEFYDILHDVWAEDGAVYKPRLTPETRALMAVAAKKDKAKAKLEALYAEYPDLRPTPELPVIEG